MLNWLRRAFRPSAGDSVHVTHGPYAGNDAVITQVDDGPMYRLFIDECCRPSLEPGQFRRLRSTRNVGRAIRRARESDPIAERGRATAAIRDWVDSVGGST